MTASVRRVTALAAAWLNAITYFKVDAALAFVSTEHYLLFVVLTT
jgi:hypothetical protein